MPTRKRHRILPVAVEPVQVTFATCEPFDTRWVADLAHMLRRDVQRVVANPLDVSRYLPEFYGVQRSIQRAQDAKSDVNDGRAILNFEQLVELGKTGEVGADDRHVVHIVDWLLQYAFEQRASDIHLEPRRETGTIRFRIDGVMHKVFELPTPVMTAVTARIKILGAHGRRRETPPAGWPHQDALGRRPRSGAAPFEHADRVRRKDGDAHLRSGHRGQGIPPARLFAGRGEDLARAWSSVRTASCWSPARPARARPRRCIRR